MVADMAPSSAKILLTGPPGCGKTTAVIRIVERLDPHKAAGFYTHEIRIDGVRKGFGWKRLDGPEGTLAHVIGNRRTERPRLRSGGKKSPGRHAAQSDPEPMRRDDR